MRQADTYSSHQDARWKRVGRDSDSATTCGHCVQALKNSALCCAELACNPTRTLARGFERSCMSARQIKPRLTQLLRLSWKSHTSLQALSFTLSRYSISSQHSPPRFVLPCAFVVGQKQLDKLRAQRGRRFWGSRGLALPRAAAQIRQTAKGSARQGRSVPWEPGIRIQVQYMPTSG
jgi:hypothetical protein